MNMRHPVIECRPTNESPCDASEYAVMSNEVGASLIPTFGVPLRYRIIRFTAAHALADGAH